MPTTTERDARIVIIGGGVIGLATAWHLGQRGERDVLLLERNRLSSGTSWHAAGIVGPLRASMPPAWSRYTSTESDGMPA